jgi:hypothetical protein
LIEFEQTSPTPLVVSVAEFGAEHEVDGAEQAEASPEVVEPQRLFDVHHRERHEYGEVDEFLQDFQLADTE